MTSALTQNISGKRPGIFFRTDSCNNVFAGAPSSPNSASSEAKEKSDAMPNISDVMLRKLKLHRGLPGWCVTNRLLLMLTFTFCLVFPV